MVGKTVKTFQVLILLLQALALPAPGKARGTVPGHEGRRRGGGARHPRRSGRAGRRVREQPAGLMSN